MWIYEKRLQYPIRIKNTDPHLAQLIMAQYGGPDGEIGASMRYLSQRYAMPYPELRAILTDVGTEELAHMEMVCAIVYQLTRNLTQEQIRSGGFSTYFINHTTSNFPCDANGMPFSAATLQVTGDPITDVHEDLAAEQKARTTYDNILRMTDDPDVLDAIRFLRAREVVHYQRFGEGLRIITDNLDDRNFYAFNPAFDTSVMKQAGAQQQRTAPAQRQAAQKTAPVQQQAVQKATPAQQQAAQKTAPSQQQSPLVTARTGKCTVEETTEIQGSFCGISKNK